jgi:4-amino-4-deoxy-L-arabinose transferase
MVFSHFTPTQILPFTIGAALLLTSIISFQKKESIGLLVLFLGSLAFGIFIANLDPFLILWDEQYHALVAKNMMRTPLRPMLFVEPQFDFNYKNWTANNIWLHKQPLFLWQMALSLKLFGTSAFAVRIPSIIMHAIIPLFIYRIGRISLNKTSAYIGALIFAVAYFPLELVAGRYSTDHNDIAFLFYITASFWAWFEYQHSKKLKWLILIGVFSGGAILVKWLMGGLILFVWFVAKLTTDKELWFRVKTYRTLLISTAVCFIVFIPWQIYIHLNFPQEANYEYALMASHFSDSVESHTGGNFFHFTTGVKTLYGSGVVIPILLLLGLGVMLKDLANKKYKVVVISSIVFVYLFYSIAATKMIAFAIVVMPFVYLGLGHLIQLGLKLLSKNLKSITLKYTVTVITLMLVAFVVLNPTKIANYHTMWKPNDNHERAKELAEMRFIHSLNELLPDNHVIFNANITAEGHIPVMFFTDHTAYNYVPTIQQIELLKSNNKRIAILELSPLPEYIILDSDIRIIKLSEL